MCWTLCSCAIPRCLENWRTESGEKEKEAYIATYILDPTDEKREALLHVSVQLGKKLVNMLDGWPGKFAANKRS